MAMDSQVILANLRETATTLRYVGLTEFINMAHGETLASQLALKVIPSEALGSATSTKEPLESRAPSNASSNEPQECPAPLVGDDVLRSSRKLESWDKEPSEDIATV